MCWQEAFVLAIDALVDEVWSKDRALILKSIIATCQDIKCMFDRQGQAVTAQRVPMTGRNQARTGRRDQIAGG